VRRKTGNGKRGEEKTFIRNIIPVLLQTQEWLEYSKGGEVLFKTNKVRFLNKRQRGQVYILDRLYD